jgi:hypothetical protein
MKSVAILAAVLVDGIGVQLIFLNTPRAEADFLPLNEVRVDISQLHQNAKSLPTLRLHAMSLVFPGGD